MNRLLIGIAVFCFLSSAAHAQALNHSRRSDATIPVTSSWRGFYVGVGLGTKISDVDWSATCFGAACQTGTSSVFFVDDSSPRSFGGSRFRPALYVGFNWQVADWIVGLEADVGWGDKFKSSAGIPGCTTNCGNLPPTPDDIDSAWLKMGSDRSLRARLGYLVMSNILLYGTGGIARQRIQANLTCSFAGPWCFPPSALDIRNETRAATLKGWTVGGGLEWMLYDHWLLRGEYRYSDFGHFRPVFFGGTGDDVFTDIRVVTHIVTFGIGYKF